MATGAQPRRSRGARRRLMKRWMPGETRHYAYAYCDEREYEIVKRFAQREGLSISDFVRRCINAWLLEEGDDIPLLVEYKRDRVDADRGSGA